MRRLLGIKVTTVRWTDNGARGRWSVASGRGGLRFARLGSQPAPQFGREQLTPKLVEIGQGKHSLRRARFLARPRYLTLANPHSCLTIRKACSPRARVRERARLIIRQRLLSGLRLGRRLIR